MKNVNYKGIVEELEGIMKGEQGVWVEYEIKKNTLNQEVNYIYLVRKDLELLLYCDAYYIDEQGDKYIHTEQEIINICKNSIKMFIEELTSVYCVFGKSLENKIGIKEKIIYEEIVKELKQYLIEIQVRASVEHFIHKDDIGNVYNGVNLISNNKTIELYYDILYSNYQIQDDKFPDTQKEIIDFCKKYIRILFKIEL